MLFFHQSPLLVLLEACTLVALVGGAALAVDGARRLSQTEAALVGALFLVGLALRLKAPAVPHDINLRAWGALSMGGLDVDRGFGLPAFGRVLHLVVPGWESDERWFFHAEAVVGALTGTALFAWLRTIGAQPVVALTAAALFATSTPHVRLSHTDSQQIPALCFGVVGLAAWASYVRTGAAWRAWVAACALTASACGRVECAAVPGVVALLALVDPAGVPWRRPTTALALGASVVVSMWHLVLVAFISGWDMRGYASQGGASLLTDHPLRQFGLSHMVLTDPTYTAPLLSLLIVAGAFVAPLTRGQRIVLAVSALALSNLVPAWSPVRGEAMAIARYQVGALPFALALAAGAVGWAWDRATSGIARTLLVTGVLVSGAARLPVNWQPTTHSEEYAFLQHMLREGSEGFEDCTLLFEEWPFDAGLQFPAHLVELYRHGCPDGVACGFDPKKLHSRQTWDGALDECTLYYRGASCDLLSTPTATNDPDALCPPIPGTAQAMIREAKLPSRQWVYDSYRPAVHVGLYRLVDVRSGQVPSSVEALPPETP